MFDYSSFDATTSDDIAGAMYRAMQIKPASIQMDFANHSAVMKASRYDYWYTVTLSSCDCDNFSKWDGKVPCKHMFRLALELGTELNFPALDPVSGSKYNPSSDLDILHMRWVNGEITYDAYRSCKSALEKSVREAKKLKKALRRR